MPSFKQLAAGAGLLSIAAAGPKSCPTTNDTPLSCRNTTAVDDLCCFNHPGGQLLQTQFWDTNPSTGPVDSWTVHGLWPDYCDGTYPQFCDKSREYTNISAIINAADPGLHQYMDTYWKDYQGNDESFWAHEWDKHGTCISSLEPHCYTDYKPQEEVVDYFRKAVELYKTLPSYKFLSDAGIVPSTSKTYSSSAILAALKAPRGVGVTIQCRNGELDEIWYFYNTRGSAQTGEFVPSEPDGAKSSCPAQGVKYLPKSGNGGGGGGGGSTTTTTTKTTSTTSQPGGDPTGTPSPFSGRGTLAVTSSGKQQGCLISTGKWMVGATCATYTAAAAASSGQDGFTLSSSKGPCAVGSDGAFACASGTKAQVFASGADGRLAAAAGQSGGWAADEVPASTKQVAVRSGAGSVQVSIAWAK